MSDRREEPIKKNVIRVYMSWENIEKLNISKCANFAI